MLCNVNGFSGFRSCYDVSCWRIPPNLKEVLSSSSEDGPASSESPSESLSCRSANLPRPTTHFPGFLWWMLMRWRPALILGFLVLANSRLCAELGYRTKNEDMG